MGKIKLVISMDWEGCDLHDSNLNAIAAFKRKYRCPFTHYLNAGYYTNPNTRNENVTEKIRNILGQDDEAGLHLHAPKHLVEAAGVGLKTAPTFSKHGDFNRGFEFGQEVMLHGYSKSELDALIGLSKSLLEDKGFAPIKSFRAGGWMCDEKIFDSLADYDFEVESSATVADFLEGSSWENDNLQRYISLIWDGITPNSAPYFVKRPKKELLEIPNNLGAIDYWKEQWLPSLADICRRNARETGAFVAVVNSHQETFKEHGPKLEALLDLFLSEGDDFEFVTNKEVLRSLKAA